MASKQLCCYMFGTQDCFQMIFYGIGVQSQMHIALQLVQIMLNGVDMNVGFCANRMRFPYGTKVILAM